MVNVKKVETPRNDTVILSKVPPTHAPSYNGRAMGCVYDDGVCMINSLRPSFTYICASKITIIGLDNGLNLSPGRRQAIIWTNARILLFGSLRTTFGEMLIEIYKFSFKKMFLKMSSGKWQPFCLSPNVLRIWSISLHLSLPRFIKCHIIWGRVIPKLVRVKLSTWGFESSFIYTYYSWIILLVDTFFHVLMEC